MEKMKKYKHVGEQLERPDKSPFLQIVRWRMRRWAPKNPSKIFYVRTPTAIDPEEWQELRTRYAHHNTTMRAIKRIWKEEAQAAVKQDLSEGHEEEEKRLFELVLEENKKWNEETAKTREARQAKIDKEQQEATLQAILQVEEEKAIAREANRKLVLREKAQIKNFITLENLEEEIEKSLNTRISYNFAIDLKGNKYVELPDGSVAKEDKQANAQDVQQAQSS